MPDAELDRLLAAARPYRSRGVVTAARLGAGRSWTTSRGSELHAEPGDWLLEDAAGDSWTVGAELFARDYVALAGGRYVKQAVVEAVRLPGRTEVPTREGPSVGEPGDWLLRGADGELWTVPASRFAERYEPAG